MDKFGDYLVAQILALGMDRFINVIVGVLDCFCHTGAFALHACKYGAKSVVAVDISDEALAQAKRNRVCMRQCVDILHEYQITKI